MLEPTLNRCVQVPAGERYRALVNEYTRRIMDEGALPPVAAERYHPLAIFRRIYILTG